MKINGFRITFSMQTKGRWGANLSLIEIFSSSQFYSLHKHRLLSAIIVMRNKNLIFMTVVTYKKRDKFSRIKFQRELQILLKIAPDGWLLREMMLLNTDVVENDCYHQKICKNAQMSWL